MTETFEPAIKRCEECGGGRFRWRVKRIQASGVPASQRSLVWVCKECGAEFEESLSTADGETRSDAETTGARDADAPARWATVPPLG
jgi:hypothetical protein